MWIRATLTATDPEGLTASVEGVFLTKWGPPKVKSVSVVPDAGNDDTYALGDVIRVAVRFDDPVSVDTSGGVPRLTRTTCPRSLQVEPCRDRGLSLHPFEEVPPSKKEFLISSHTLTAVSERAGVRRYAGKQDLHYSKDEHQNSESDRHELIRLKKPHVNVSLKLISYWKILPEKP